MGKGLILEGGAMRGLFTAGVIDTFLEEKIEFDMTVGVSAGAAFGCNLKSKQKGRVLRYNTEYCKDKRYCSLYSLIKTGDLYGADFCYRELPEELDKFDTDTFSENKMDFYVVSTDIETGKPHYTKCEKGNGDDLMWFRASASMPLVSRIVEIDGKKYLDGGMSDSVPVKFAESIGYDKNVIVLTQPYDYIKKKNKAMPIVKRMYKKYPKLVRIMEERHIVYNDTLDYIKKLESEGKAIVLRPEKKLEVGKIEKNPERLKKAWEEGRAVAQKNIEKIRKFYE